LKKILIVILVLLGLFLVMSSTRGNSLSDSGITQTPTPSLASYHIDPLPNAYKGNLTPEPILKDKLTGKEIEQTNPFNGYYWYGTWVPGMLSERSQFLTMPDIFEGSAIGYGPNLMEATSAFFGISLENVEDGVALSFCSEIGTKVWLKRPYNPKVIGTGIFEGPFIVVDCGARNDIYGQVMGRKEVVEVGFKTALKWKMVTNLSGASEAYSWGWDQRRIDGVIVSKIPPECLPAEYTPVKLYEWFPPLAEFDNYKDLKDATLNNPNPSKVLHKTIYYSPTKQQVTWRLPWMNPGKDFKVYTGDKGIWVSFNTSTKECK
jgi:hypothetical protein